MNCERARRLWVLTSAQEGVLRSCAVRRPETLCGMEAQGQPHRVLSGDLKGDKDWAGKDLEGGDPGALRRTEVEGQGVRWHQTYMPVRRAVLFRKWMESGLILCGSGRCCCWGHKGCRDESRSRRPSERPSGSVGYVNVGAQLGAVACACPHCCGRGDQRPRKKAPRS